MMITPPLRASIGIQDRTTFRGLLYPYVDRVS